MPRIFRNPQTWGTVVRSWGDQGINESSGFGALVLGLRLHPVSKQYTLELSILQSEREIEITLSEAESFMNLLDNPENSVEIYQVLIEVHTVFRKIIFAQVGTLIRGLHHVVLALDPRTLHLRFKAVLCCFSFDSSLPCLMHGLKAGQRRIDMHSLPWGDPSRRLRRAGSEGPLSNVRSRSFLPKALERGTQGERSRLGYAALQLGSGRVLVLCRCRSGPTSATVASGPRPAESVGRLVYAGQGGSPSWMPWRSALSPGRLPVRCLLSRARGAIRPHASHGAARAGGGDAVHGVGARPGRRRQPGTHARTHDLGGFSARWAERPSRKGGGRRVPGAVTRRQLTGGLQGIPGIHGSAGGAGQGGSENADGAGAGG